MINNASALRKRALVTGGAEFLGTRIFNTYGPRIHPNDGRVVSRFILQTLKNEPITLFGDSGALEDCVLRTIAYFDSELSEGFALRHRSESAAI